MDNWLRPALASDVAVNQSNRAQSLGVQLNQASLVNEPIKATCPLVARFGSMLRLIWPKFEITRVFPDHCCQVGSGSAEAFKSTVCQGVPRWTRPSQPMFGSLLVGNGQSSDLVINGSLTFRSVKVLLALRELVNP